MHLITKLPKSNNGYIHYNTSNISFIDTMNELRDRGVENRYFMLALFNPDLAEVDPHSTSLTKEVQAAIQVECMQNPWYFIREVIRIPSGKNTYKFDLNLQRAATLYCIWHGFSAWTVNIRQTGKSTLAACIGLYEYAFGRIEQSKYGFGIYARSIDDSKKIMRRIKNINSVLPPYLKLPDNVFVHTKHGTHFADEHGYCVNDTNTSKIAIFRRHHDDDKILHNTIDMELLNNMYFSDAEFIPDLPKIINQLNYNRMDMVHVPSNINSAVNNGVEQRGNSLISKLFVKVGTPDTPISTANNSKIEPFMDFFKNPHPTAKLFSSAVNDLKDPVAKFLNFSVFPHMLRWKDYYYDLIPTPEFSKEIKKIRSIDNNFMDVFYIEYNYLELGFTEARIQQFRKMLSNDTIFRREILLERFDSSFDVEE